MHTALLLDMVAGSFPDRAALGPSAASVSYGELAERARAGAVTVEALGEGSLVFIGLNGPTLPVAVFAAGLLGRPFAPLNYRLVDEELRRLLARTAPSVAVVDDDMLARVAGVEGVTLLARSDFEAACLDPANRAGELAEVEPDIAVLLFTSGTTGEPKAAVLRHRHLAAYVISTVEFMGADEDEAALVSVPPYHIAGVSAVLTGVYGGRRVVHLPAFTPEAWVEAAVAEQITHAMVVPTMLGRVLDLLQARGETLPHLRALSYGGGRMPQPVIERALAMLPHVAFVNAYGLTETSSTIAVLGPDDHRRAIASDDPAVRRRLGSVGRPLHSLELEIRGPSGEPMPAGAAGEVWVRGEQISGEYLGRKLIRDDGWFPTNDSGWLDEEGYLFVEGRLDDVIVRGGENISPGEIEDVLRAHPSVRDVAVIGLPDEQWGERVAAVVVADPPVEAETLADWVRQRLRSTKTPQAFFFRPALPYNETGKLLRRALRAELAAPVPA
ncbi:acyl-CoA synthetase (AMP-forming)/AMP-acid ligase II [Caulobacter ginsengisoli]|uniref:Acyl-CoA synthetase (AMP-forming)/AMP-acid ligase II n=1 Tax=Caulobacter ginsengisoli TaxID=400775 RepID=A0ABU0IY22_9CAUL|nr:AMP-binding protein [Caulobacter ginsengisoli]MDQ0466895.1 acyl-CoA synthetase (AMP-forming)/AMP-acid ligase II [Caulobacter ginsengisoli]